MNANSLFTNNYRKIARVGSIGYDKYTNKNGCFMQTYKMGRQRCVS